MPWIAWRQYENENQESSHMMWKRLWKTVDNLWMMCISERMDNRT
jgi:hypothetical protein